MAGDIKTPLLVWDINFNGDSLDKPPRPMTKEQIESQQEDVVASLPIRTYSTIEYLTATRRATVTQEAAGLKDKPVLFVYEESEQPPRRCRHHRRRLGRPTHRADLPV